MRTDEQKANLLAWADALESGEWTQGQEYLKQVAGNDYAYCCLGVLCELHSVPLFADSVVEVYGVRTEDGDTVHDSLPREVKRALGIVTSDVNTCIKMNDDVKYNFTQIAHVVRFAVKHDMDFETAYHDTYNTTREM